MGKKYRTGFKNAFFYMCHINNLKSILEEGVLSHNQVLELGKKPSMISNLDIVQMRGDKKINGKSLNDFANVYFRVKNAMHYRVMKRLNPKDVVILCLRKDITKLPGAIVTDGNAANLETSFFEGKSVGRVVRSIDPVLKLEWWSKADGSIRKMMAECLVPDRIPSDYITRIITLDPETKKKIENEIDNKRIRNGSISLYAQPDFFNQPADRVLVTPNISLIEGDMFFSDKQTLTVSVNMVGVMGKGLASTVKFIFPDVFKKYVEVLENGKMKMGEPFLYKRDASILEVLGEEEYIDEEEPTWVLIFPTKNHWSYKSDFNGIKDGLIYLKNNYRKLGIKSLALPALGCGLGWLSWREVGPVMVKHLSEMNIPVEIYLPREGERIPNDQKSKEFLLGSR